MNLADLRKPFPPDRISWRVGSTTKDKSKGMALAYIDARDVQDRLDEVCGVEGWQCRYIPMHDKKTVCEIGICVVPAQIIRGDQGLTVKDIIPACWVWKADGAGDSDVEAEKGALSDAFKRAAVKWGIGRYLYDLESPWVALEPAGNSYKIASGEYARLEKLLGAKPSPAPKPAAPPPSQPSPPDAYTKAKEWVAAAETAIATLKTREAMAKWMHLNIGALDKVREADKGLYDAINIKISQRNSFIEEMAAA